MNEDSPPESLDIPETKAYKKYIDNTTGSKEWYEQSTDFLPGGNTRTTVYHDPYPVYVDHGRGCYVEDVDGTEYLDFFNNAASLVHGHSPPVVVKQVRESIQRNIAPGGPTRAEVELAELLCNRVTAIERVRFTNSGTEATMNAIRAARGYTGNDVIAKFEGIYHGTHDDAQISVNPPLQAADSEESPQSVPESAGIPDHRVQEVLTLPFNDVDASLAKLERRKSELAGVIIAPYMGSKVIPATDSFITRLAEFTSEYDVPLIFDEVMSFRTAFHGVHTEFDVEPDLVTLGKIIGGGFPVGAFGGRREILQQFSPHSGEIKHSGTFNGNPITAKAGLVTLESFSKSEVERVNELAKKLEGECRSLAKEHGVQIEVNTAGSLFNLYIAGEPIRDYRDAYRASKDLERLLYLELLSHGIRVAPKLFGSISTPMDEDHVDKFVAAMDWALTELEPQFDALGYTS